MKISGPGGTEEKGAKPKARLPETAALRNDQSVQVVQRVHDV
jgi:hypothetical protein